MIAVKGKDALIYRWDGTAAAFRVWGCASSISLDVEEGIIPCATIDSGDYNDYVSGETDYSIDVTGLLTTGETTKTQFADILLDRKTVQQIKIEMVDSSSNAVVINCYALIQNIKADLPTEGFATWSVTMKGCGAFTITNTIITPTPSTSENVEPIYLYGTGATEVSDSDLNNVTEILLVLRAGQFYTPITVGSPSSTEVLYIGWSGSLSFADPVATGEPIYCLYKP
jgi:hypothetical protein